MNSDATAVPHEEHLDGQKPTVPYPEDVCPEDVCSCWSDAVLAWVTPFFSVAGGTESLSAEQLWPLPADLKPGKVSADFEKIWAQEFQAQRQACKKTRGGAFLRSVLWKLSWRSMVRAGCFKFLYYPLSAAGPLIIRRLITFFEERYDSSGDASQRPVLWHAAALVSVLMLSNLTQSMGILKYFYVCSRQGVYLRTCLGHAILRKALRLRSNSFSDGDICTMMAVDAERILLGMPFIQYMWSVPVQVTTVMILLYTEVQWAAFSGLAMLLLLMPLQSKISRSAGVIRRKQVIITGKRTHVLNEALVLMRGLMLCGWDDAKYEELRILRKRELWYVACALVLKGINAALVFIWPVLVTLVTFLVYAKILAHRVSVGTVYATLGYFSLLRWPLIMIPNVVSGLADSQIGLERIEVFLCSDEPGPPQILPRDADLAIKLNSADLAWPSCSSLLHDISLEIPKRSMALVVGAVGSGKSSLLFALAGECPKLRGDFLRCANVSFVSSKPWLLNTTLRENIITGLPFDETYYTAVLDACALQDDMAQWPLGDETLLGEQGQAISGGQRQRVALARACYSRPALALLDDPLSALDPLIAQHVWENVVKRVLAGITRVVATGRPDRAADADIVVVLSSGRVLSADEATIEQQRLAGACSKLSLEAGHCPSTDAKAFGTLKPQSVELEAKRSGRVGLSVWALWAGGYGCGVWHVLTMLFLACQGGRLLSDYFLGKWAEALSGSGASSDADQSTWMSMWLVGAAATLLLTFLKAGIFTAGSVRTTSQLHDAALRRVFSAPIGWFEVTPAGRILNRFGRDIDMVDVLLPPFVEASVTWLTEICGILTLVAIVAPLAFVPSIVAFFTLLRVSRRIQPTIVELKRLDGALASPLYARFSDVLAGLTVIRASCSEQVWIERHLAEVDMHARATFLFHACQRRFSYVVNVLGNVAIGSTAVALVILAELKMPTITPVSVGLVLVYVMQLTFGFAALMQQYIEAESTVSSVERLSDCACEDTVDKYNFRNNEATSSKSATSSWPTSGCIDFSNVAVSYSSDMVNCVLHDVNLRIEPGECIGIVGRSGSGKSSLLAALFGMARVLVGKIKIDHVDLATLPLRIVRQRLALIPQEAVVFSGTVRHNLVCILSLSDDELWQVLEMVGLSATIQAFPEQLAAEVGDMGCGLSSGQKQLLCLARTLLRRCAVLALDEATAHVDAATELVFKKALNGTMLRQTRPTVLCVAHRLESLTVAERILVVSNGSVWAKDDKAGLISL